MTSQLKLSSLPSSLFEYQQSFLSVFLSTDIQELARQNKITKQILEAYINKKLGVRNTFIRPPSIHDILPKNMKTRQKTEMSDAEAPEAGDSPEGLEGQEQEGQEISEDDSLQSVESEQIDSIYDNAGNLTTHSRCKTVDGVFLTVVSI